jgi:hypothetical protein
VFNNRIISAGLLAPRLLNLSVCDFYLWGNLKGKFYRNTLCTAEALQNEIRNVVASISAEELQHIAQGFLRRCKGCLRAVGNHFSTIWHLSFQCLVLLEQMVSSHRMRAGILVLVLDTAL